MRIARILACALLSLPLAVHAEDATEETRNRPPTRIPISGFLQTVTGESRQGEVTLVLSIYEDRDSAEPLWSEEQTVILREGGRYEVALGGTSAEGLASELFSANAARWVGIAEKHDLEQPRFMLVSVPYATKALDAEAVGGRPVKDFVLADELEEKVASVLAGGRAIEGSQSGVSVQSAPLLAGGARSVTRELKPRSEADAPVAAAGRFANEVTTGAMYGVHAHVHSTSGGAADGGVTGVFGEVTPTSPGGFSAGVRGVNRGTGGFGIGVVGVQDGSGWGVYGATPSGIGVYGTSGTGIGVYGLSAGSAAAVFASRSGSVTNGPALEIQGGIKLSGTHRPAFVHTASGGSTYTLIDHPLANGQPEAILLVTQRVGTSSFAGLPPTPTCCPVGTIGVAYEPSYGRWMIGTDNGEIIPAGARFHVLVINQ